MADYPLVNGRLYSHASAELQVALPDGSGVRIINSIMAINWSQSRSPGQLRGSQAEVIATTRGTYEAEASMTLPLQDMIDLISTLNGGDATAGYMDRKFNITVNYSDLGVPVTTVDLVGCELTEDASGSEEGEDPVANELSMHVMRVDYNGAAPLSDMLV